jgi:tetratricopeptide (TPR) repeat protein
MSARLLALALALGLATSPARGDSIASRARLLFDRAETHFSLGEFKQALELYREAYRLKPLAGFLFNIGQCHRKLGRCDQAVFFFKQFLDKLPRAPNRALVEDLVRECEATLAAARKPRPPEPTPTPATSAVPPPQILVTPIPGKRREPVRYAVPLPPPARRGPHPAWFWTTAALSVGLLATGAVTGGLTLGQSNEYNDPLTSKARRLELKESGERLGTISTATLAAGGGTALIAAILLITMQRAPSAETRVSAAPSAGGGLVSLEGRF